MFDPVAFGINLMRLCLDSWQLALKAGETATASSLVIHHRLGMLAAVGLVPSQADIREMNLMVSEKAKAFTKAATVLGNGGAMSPMALVGAYSAALDPIHAAATANARRLQNKTGSRESFTRPRSRDQISGNQRGG